MKTRLYGKTKTQIAEIVKDHGLPKFTTNQITDWLYHKDVTSIAEMSNLSKKARTALSEKYEVGLKTFLQVSESKDGTKKYLFQSDSGHYIEAAYIPDKDRHTLCVSSQAGCKMGCLFCMTGKQGFQAHLSAGEILNQLRSIPEFRKITNLVYMGMGEPMDNIDAVLQSLEILNSDYGYAMSPKRINVSTIGIIPAMERFLKESRCHLAISIHSPFNDERQKLMPIQTIYPIEKVCDVLRNYDWNGQRRLTFEYIIFKGVNDSTRHVKALTKLLHGLKCRVNLIIFHQVPGAELQGAERSVMEQFKNELNKKGVLTTIRSSRGEDIEAACGLLSTKEMVTEEEPDF